MYVNVWVFASILLCFSFSLFCPTLFFLLIILFNYYFNAFLAFEKVRDRKCIYLARRGEKVGGFLQDLRKGNLHIEHLE